MFIRILSLIIVFMISFSAPGSAEEILPIGTKLIFPDRREMTLTQEWTMITDSEKEILVRNDDVCQVEKEEMSVLKDKVAELEKKSGIDDREIQLQKDRADLEQSRSAFYKEQIEVRDKFYKDSLDRMEKMAKENQPTWFDKLVQKGGWAGVFMVIGAALVLAF